MLTRLLKAIEPHMKAFAVRYMYPWKGNLVKHGDFSKSTIPWGFVSQDNVRSRVMSARDIDSFEGRAKYLNLDTKEFLVGAEAAYRCITSLFAQRGPGQTSSDDAENGLSVTQAASTDFLQLEVASPQMSMFLNDVLYAYGVRGLVPRLTVRSVKATLCNVGVRFGGVSKNRNFMGTMSADEVKYNLTMGMLGPEGVVINELEGRGPQKVIADVKFECEEDFVLEDGTGHVIHSYDDFQPKVHFLTFQSNIDGRSGLEWQVTNINDAIQPELAYYFRRFGH